jgi:hypothetical protein
MELGQLIMVIFGCWAIYFIVCICKSTDKQRSDASNMASKIAQLIHMFTGRG